MTSVAVSSSVSLYAQLAYPEAQLMTAANDIPSFALSMIGSGYQSVVGQSPLGHNASIPPFLSMPPPSAMMSVMQPIAGAGYAQAMGPERYSSSSWMARLFDPQQREGARMERALRGDPFARAAFEQAIGGRVLDYGGARPGQIMVQRQQANPYARALGGGALSPMAAQLGGLYQQMSQGLVGGPTFATGAGGSIGSSPFLPLAVNGFAGMANQLLGAAPGGFDSFNGGVQGMAPLMGQGQASWNPLAAPGKIQGGNAAREGAHSAQVNSVLSDPSLTMEDKIMLSLMIICQKMDDDIKRQSEYLNQLQNQQGARGKKGGGKAGGEKSIDLETKKLERMVQKRSQLFDTLGKIMERYDQSAKNVIQSMRG